MKHDSHTAFLEAATNIAEHTGKGADLPKAALWAVDRNSISYKKDGHHTLSLYLKGGENSYRHDQASNKGQVGRLCIMPKGQETSWEIAGPINFAHLYISDEQLDFFTSRTFERDSRLINLKDTVYKQDEILRTLMLKRLQLDYEGAATSLLAKEETTNEILYRLTTNHCSGAVPGSALKGGLSHMQLKKVMAFVDESTCASPSLEDMAEVVGLSPFHFARMFKKSCGLSPASFVMRHRLEKVKDLLVNSDKCLASISAVTGFAQQSHMTERFKRYTGTTPAKWRKGA
ncbi:helix-turn-helix transcriptional regulator [Kordiimonas sp. SCSIO 12603]|uniref:AraC family transcriptional regulator n=1 Tax=Kordiimonas sp. SCSIO 12603 TaxID=2829596 RepID=UPI002106B49B|nr:AraC family transcriptional regulator [Kordiimonas sp. SCSIO 12603]UTW59881.1 helix-turn-helix transcriptional regulator [Kordiimonas sp. SCSIO 12603]